MKEAPPKSAGWGFSTRTACALLEARREVELPVPALVLPGEALHVVDLDHHDPEHVYPRAHPGAGHDPAIERIGGDTTREGRRRVAGPGEARVTEEEALDRRE